MADLPEATVTIDDEAGALAGGTDLLTVIACVEMNADITPRVFSSTKALLGKHGFSPGVDYCSSHFDETKKPVVFIGLPTETDGTIFRIDQSGNTGTSAVSVVAGANGVLDEVAGMATVKKGGTVGTDQILLDLSLDGGQTTKTIRVGTATTYPIPYYGLVLTLGAGTLVAGDIVVTFRTTAPRWDQAGLAAARAALVSQQKQSRSWLVVGDLVTNNDAADVVAQVNAYETANDRFVFARAQVRDRRPEASLSKAVKRMSAGGAPTLTFANVASADTITRSAGSWLTDGFVVGDVVTVTGTTLNNVTGPIAVLTATVLTFGAATSLVAEGPVSNAVVTGSPGLTFAEVGTTGDTITRSSGSWLTDGFQVGDMITVTGTTLNNVTGPITALAATVLTFGTTDLAAEVVGGAGVSITGGEDDPSWVASIDSTFASIDAERRIDLGAGRGLKQSPITGWRLRRPVQWAASLREYQHDVQIPCWRKTDGPCAGWKISDDGGNQLEHDERVDGGLLLARFTCFRSYANGPLGPFIALSVTRAAEGSLLSRTHNMAIADIAQAVTQAETENAIGQVLQVKADGTGTEDSLTKIEERVNTRLGIALLQNGKEGPRASDAKYKASRTDILNVVPATLNGTVDLRIGSTLEKLNTTLRILTAG